jgi:hypothetical protein
VTFSFSPYSSHRSVFVKGGRVLQSFIILAIINLVLLIHLSSSASSFVAAALAAAAAATRRDQ